VSDTFCWIFKLNDRLSNYLNNVVNFTRISVFMKLGNSQRSINIRTYFTLNIIKKKRNVFFRNSLHLPRKSFLSHTHTQYAYAFIRKNPHTYYRSYTFMWLHYVRFCVRNAKRCLKGKCSKIVETRRIYCDRFPDNVLLIFLFAERRKREHDNL